MSERVTGSVGEALREARESQQITLDDVALRLRLMHRQIEAMESDDFESLGQPVFARGFVRNYARLLGLEPDPLLARMGGAPAEPGPVSQTEAAMPRSWLTSPWVIVFMLGLLVVVAVPVGLYWWLNSDAAEPQHVAPLRPVAPAPVADVVQGAPAAPGAESPAPEAPTEADAQEANAQEANAQDAATVGSGGAAATVGEPTEPGASATAARGVLHLEFGGESWVEVKDASGRMLHRQLEASGSSVDISGQPPFDVVIGNADQVRMTYNGRPFDLKPFVAVTVARFTLEE